MITMITIITIIATITIISTIAIITISILLLIPLLLLFLLRISAVAGYGGVVEEVSPRSFQYIVSDCNIISLQYIIHIYTLCQIEERVCTIH